MDILSFVFGILILVTILSVGTVALGVFGITKIVQIVANRLSGGRRQKTIGVPRQPQPKNIPPQAATPAQPQHVRSYVYLDVDGGATPDSIAKAMRDYEQERVVGPYARDVVNTLRMAERRKKSLFSEINNRFSPKSISWDHFAATVNEAFDTIVRNCALLANRVQAFDVEDYERSEQFYRTGGEMHNGKQNPALIKRWELLRETKAQMDEIRAANDGLLLELDKLSAELVNISNNESTDQSARIAEEVSRLAEETKYYR